MKLELFLLVLLVMLVGCIVPASASSPRKVIISTDIGSDIDDAWALAFALKCPELEIDSVITSHGPTPGRAKIAAKLLSIAGRDDIPVIVGRCRKISSNKQRDWAKGFVPQKPLVADGARALARRVMSQPGKITIIPLGPLTDVGEMIKIEPRVKEKIDEIILMGGSAYHGYRSNSPPCAEYNILSDVRAAQTVFESGIPIVMAGLDVTTTMQPSPEQMKLIAESDKPLVKAMQELFIAWEYPTPTLFDVVAVALAFQRDLIKMDYKCIEVTDDGFTTIISDGKPNAWVCADDNKAGVMNLFMERTLN